MNTLLQMRTEVKRDLTISDSSSFYSDAVINSALNRAYIKVGGAYRWSETEDALKTQAGNDQDYYDYPTNWRPDSIWKLKIDGSDYGDPLTFKDFLHEKEEDRPSGLTKMWANQWRRYFVYPTPTEGVDICIWGQKVVEEMSEDSDTTIFSYSMPEVNEAIVLEAEAILKKKGEKASEGQFISAEAAAITARAWNKTRQDQARQETTTPMWDVPDMFGKRRISSKNRIGNF